MSPRSVTTTAPTSVSIDRDAGPASCNTSFALAAEPSEAELTIELPDRKPVTVRTYGAKQAGVVSPLVLHFHGGTFVCGDLDNGRTVARLLVKAGAVVVSLAYPLAPEHPFPEPIEVGYAVLQWLYKQRTKMAGKGAPLYLAGEEAGGNLATAVAMVCRDHGAPPLAGQILVSPMLDPCAGTPSMREANGDAVECRWAAGWREFLRGPKDAVHPYAVPSTSIRLGRMAPTLVLVGEDDPLKDEAMAYAQRLREAGITVTSNVLGGRDSGPETLSSQNAECAACAASLEQHFREFFLTGQAPPT
ncbi:MAG: alpha/beta hydrolase [Rhizobacter sp.]|nr:alpha/beta hydrolase [Rhizobacter sp.]